MDHSLVKQFIRRELGVSVTQRITRMGNFHKRNVGYVYLIVNKVTLRDFTSPCYFLGFQDFGAPEELGRGRQLLKDVRLYGRGYFVKVTVASVPFGMQPRLSLARYRELWDTEHNPRFYRAAPEANDIPLRHPRYAFYVKPGVANVDVERKAQKLRAQHFMYAPRRVYKNPPA